MSSVYCPNFSGNFFGGAGFKCCPIRCMEVKWHHQSQFVKECNWRTTCWIFLLRFSWGKFCCLLLVSSLVEQLNGMKEIKVTSFSSKDMHLYRAIVVETTPKAYKSEYIVMIYEIYKIVHPPAGWLRFCFWWVDLCFLECIWKSLFFFFFLFFVPVNDGYFLKCYNNFSHISVQLICLN